ncbi:MAG: WYL domain-containing protein [Bacteroidota bacterium]
MTVKDSHASVQKILKLLMLLSGTRKYSKTEITEDLEIPDRSFYRYLKTLKDFGFIIENKNSLYQIAKNSGHLRQISDLLHFSDEEAYILNEAIHNIESSTKARGNLISKLSALYDSDRIATQFVGKEKSSKIKPLLDAIKDKKQVKLIAYKSSGSGNITDRIVEPFEFTANYISIWVYEPKSRKNKLFKVSRMQKVELLEYNWSYENKHEADLLDCFRIGGKKKIPVKFEMSLRAKNLLIEEYPLSEKFITSINENNYIFDGWVTALEGIGRFILGLPGEFFNIESNDLKQFIKTKQKFFENF